MSLNTPAPHSTPTNRAAVEQLLGPTHARRWWQSPTVWLGIVAVAAAAGGWAWWSAREAAAQRPVYVSEPLQRGTIALTVAANGTLGPTRTVSVGSELSGTVSRVLVDINDRVKKGQVLVELDTDKLIAQLGRSRASLNSAQARLAQVQATARDAATNLQRLEQVHQLSGGQVPSQAELDTARTSVEKSSADVAVAKAAVDDARAAVSTDETNLSKAAIKSPIDGVILTRAVDPGNAVAASFQAVTLFTVAESLDKLRLEVAVDEADVGTVAEGQEASFTVSAYPVRRYPARVVRVNYGSTKTDNVVTYTALLVAANEDGSLRPGMTASATIRAQERQDVLMAPNAALRFSPVDAAQAKAAAQQSKSLASSFMPPAPPQRNRNPSGARGARGEGAQSGPRTLWVLRGEGEAATPVAVKVKTGLSDGRMTEIVKVLEGELKEGDALITDQRTAASAAAPSANAAKPAADANAPRSGARP